MQRQSKTKHPKQKGISVVSECCCHSSKEQYFPKKTPKNAKQNKKTPCTSKKPCEQKMGKCFKKLIIV